MVHLWPFFSGYISIHNAMSMKQKMHVTKIWSGLFQSPCNLKPIKTLKVCLANGVAQKGNMVPLSLCNVLLLFLFPLVW